MKFTVRCAVVAALGIAMISFSTSGTTTAANNNAESIKEVMQKVNGKGGIGGQLKSGVAAKEIKWDEVSKNAKALIPLAKDLAAGKPPKGDDASWKKYTEAYVKAAEDLDKAATAKDAKAAGDALKVLNNCGGCHGAHKGK